MAGAFARWLDDLLGAQGLVVFDGADPSAKRLATDIFARELAEPERSMGLVAAACDRLRALGHQPQVEPAADGTTLFYLDEAGRHPIKRRGHMLAIGGRECTPVQLVSEATSHPERFSPNVLLRSVVQDQLFPTICYVGGPAEIAYQAELGGIYQALGVERPLLYPRASATVIDSATARFLDRFLEQPNVTFAGLQTQNELLLNQILASQIPAELERGFAAAAQEIGARIDAIRAALPAVDPTLTGAADTTRDRLIDSLKQLHGKTVQAAKRKDETLRRQFLRTQALVFPGGHPQERDLSLPFFVNRYGTGLVDRLVDGLPHEPARHYLLIP
jgi:bacillithiol biosynthesis cysteine-adding enzyme BshC